MKHLYALITTNCNLACPHCDIRTNGDDGYDENVFLNVIKDFDGTITIFGGEPTLYMNRLVKVLSLGKATSISTNLLNIDESTVSLLMEHQISIATSWNYNRFTNMQYHKWINNIKCLRNIDIPIKILITMTRDLVESDIDNFMEMISIWDHEYKIDSILFEHLIDPNESPEFNNQVDQWLCKIFNKWKTRQISIDNEIVKKLNHWVCDCRNTYTLHPNGYMTTGCPHLTDIKIVDECLTCPQSDKCMPCRLQSYCTYPKKLAKLVKEDGLF